MGKTILSKGTHSSLISVSWLMLYIWKLKYTLISTEYNTKFGRRGAVLLSSQKKKKIE